jgi:hypothetical protein
MRPSLRLELVELVPLSFFDRLAENAWAGTALGQNLSAKEWVKTRWAVWRTVKSALEAQARRILAPPLMRVKGGNFLNVESFNRANA